MADDVTNDQDYQAEIEMSRGLVQIAVAALIFSRTHDAERSFEIAKKFSEEAEKRFPKVFSGG